MTPPPAPRPLVLLHGFTGSPESWEAVRQQLAAPEEAAASNETATPEDAAAREEPAPRGERAAPKERAVPGEPAAPTGNPAPAANAGPPSTLLPPPPLAPAALGHSRSGTTIASVRTWTDELDRLASIIHDAAPEPDHLVGYSMGGRLALGLLVRHPKLFRSATLIGASPGLATEPERAERAAQDEKWARLLDEEGLDSFVAAWGALPLFASQTRLPDDVLERQDRIRRSHDPAALARSLRVLGLARMPDYRPRLAEVEIPVRLVVGERDPKFRRLAGEMAERLPRATVTVLPDAGHNPVLERPTEIARLIREDLHA